MALPETLEEFPIAPGRRGRLHALAALERAGLGAVSRLPVSLRVVLEGVVRNRDGLKVTEEHVRALAGWRPQAPRTAEVPLVVARILLQDFTGVPLICDLAAMRSAAQRLGRDPAVVEPRVPMDLVIDHSVQIDAYGTGQALAENMRLEAQRNAERFAFIKWGEQAFARLAVVPPGVGICHQVNLEHLARPLWEVGGVAFPDTVVGTDSHTTMINGLGVVGWGVGGIEAEAAMLGQPISFLLPDVVGVHLHGALPAGATATDLVLRLTELLRGARVVGKFVEYFGAGAATLSVPDRATIANMAPEYGATMGYFPVDGETLRYFAATGRPADGIAALRAWLTHQGMFGMPLPGALDYSAVVELDLASVAPSVAGPRRPQDRIPLPALKARFAELFAAPTAAGGYGKPPDQLDARYPAPPAAGPGVEAERGAPVELQSAAHRAASPVALTDAGVSGASTSESHQAGTVLRHEVEMVEAAHLPSPGAQPEADRPGLELGHGDVVIAAITSCTNTSNPGVMLAAGLLAQKAVARGLRVRPHVKTSLAPGSRVVTDYLAATGLLAPLERLGFAVAGYGCTTCIGNSGPLAPPIEACIADHDLVCAAVLSGNRNFEARIHPAIRANLLMSPPLVVAFAIAGRVGIDLDREPLGTGADGRPVFLRELWPSADELAALAPRAQDPAAYRARYQEAGRGGALWDAVPAARGALFPWAPSTYIAEPPFFADFALEPPPLTAIRGARALAIFGDSLTTDHISPAGTIATGSPAGRWLREHGVAPQDFNSYGARRGDHEVMVRGTFANVRIRNLMLPPRADGGQPAGGLTLFQPGGEVLTIHEAAQRYVAAGTPTLIFAGEEYGTGSSRDWAAKGTRLLGVRAVVARSFERIHRSNLVGMGVLPLQLPEGATHGLTGEETFDVVLPPEGLRPQQAVELVIHGPTGADRTLTLRSRIDTAVEVGYFRHGGILPYALRDLLGG